MRQRTTLQRQEGPKPPRVFSSGRRPCWMFSCCQECFSWTCFVWCCCCFMTCSYVWCCFMTCLAFCGVLYFFCSCLWLLILVAVPFLFPLEKVYDQSHDQPGNIRFRELGYQKQVLRTSNKTSVTSGLNRVSTVCLENPSFCTNNHYKK